MIPQANITAWRATAPWADDAQVEQDLVLTRALVELFSVPEIAEQSALRGGTALQKLFIVPPWRYSEDIDLVQIAAGRIGPFLDCCRKALDPWLGKPIRSHGPRTVCLIYRFDSEIAPARPLRLKLEVNTREHFSVLGFHHDSLCVENPWFSGEASITTYDVNELLGTKLRALCQRRKGRDLFDLWLCLRMGLLDPDRLLTCFFGYLEKQKLSVSRAQFEKNLYDKQTDPTFLEDIAPLLRADIEYDVQVALNEVKTAIVEKMSGAPWKGLPEEGPKKPKKRKQ